MGGFLGFPWRGCAAPLAGRVQVDDLPKRNVSRCVLACLDIFLDGSESLPRALLAGNAVPLVVDDAAVGLRRRNWMMKQTERRCSVSPDEGDNDDDDDYARGANAPTVCRLDD